jgi:hypothetical protein
MSIEESLLILWSVMIVPALVVLLYAAFTGRMTSDENRRFLAIREPERDWWDASEDDPAEEVS